MRVHCVTEIAFRLCFQRARLDDTRVVYQAIDRPKSFDAFVNGTSRVVAAADVTDNSRYFTAEAGEIIKSSGDLLLIACGDRYARTFFNEIAGEYKSKPSRPACDKDRVA